MTKDGKLSKRDMATLNKAWEILSEWTEWAEDYGCAEAEYEYLYDNAMAAVAGLCEFVNGYEG